MASSASTGQRYGVALFTLAAMAARDLEAALHLVATTGYREVEFFGPYPFSTPATIAGWDAVAAQLGFTGHAWYGHSPAEVRAMLDRLGLSAPAAHTDLATAQSCMPQLAEAAATLGHRYVIVPSVLEWGLATLDDYRRLAQEFNRIGALAAAHGVCFGYHNHGYEQALLDGRVPLDVLLDETDPALVTFELDVFWMIAGGGDPCEYLTRWPGRFALMHLKDMAQPVRFADRGQTMAEMMALFPQMRDAGDGVLDLAAIVRCARECGVAHLLLERDLASDPEQTLRRSAAALSAC
jgi:sugar phosphate isomerase/epimerase